MSTTAAHTAMTPFMIGRRHDCSSDTTQVLSAPAPSAPPLSRRSDDRNVGRTPALAPVTALAPVSQRPRRSTSPFQPIRPTACGW